MVQARAVCILKTVVVATGFFSAGVSYAAGESPDAAENWTAKRIFDPFRNETRCVAESRHQVIDDGRQETTIYLRLDERGLMVLTESNVDLNHPDVGVRVDDGALIKPDKAYLDQNAVFESSAASIISQFKAGLKADVGLRYWPTWPSKGLRTATFSLIGFTRAFARLPGC
ncbi:MAG: hypothetical protein JSW09_01800 [Pseudomonadota bacterium]|nr:MAG: hypothetical protein JSW09_01800 [Pseudomonadota bacterium]